MVANGKESKNCCQSCQLSTKIEAGARNFVADRSDLVLLGILQPIVCMTIQDKKQQLIEWFRDTESWEDKYLLLIDLGRKLPPFSEAEKIEVNRVAGCTSRVWLTGHLDCTGSVVLRATSDSQVVKGLAAVLVEIYSGSSPEAILADTTDITGELGLQDGLMPTRVIGFQAMRDKIRQIAANLGSSQSR